MIWPPPLIVEEREGEGGRELARGLACQMDPVAVNTCFVCVAFFFSPVYFPSVLLSEPRVTDRADRGGAVGLPWAPLCPSGNTKQRA